MGMTFGEQVRAMRRARGLTLREVEQRSGVSNAYVSQLETGKIKEPSPKIIRALAEALEASPQAMMEAAYGCMSEPLRGPGERLGPLNVQVAHFALSLTEEEAERVWRFMQFVVWERRA
jgi:transcriptional regulator with XRE-family HTH domain